MKWQRPARVLWLASLAGAAQAQVEPAPAQPASAAALAPLLDQVMARVANARQDNAPKESAERGLFQRLAEQQLLAQRAQAASAPAKSSTKPPAKTVSRKAAPRKPSGAASAPSAMVPALAWAMEQLDPASFAVLRPVPVGGSGALLRTGDVFVVQFSTSLPGHVRLENIDARGQTADLGTYTVFVDQLNRLPRDKGIQLQGQPGMERLRFYFYPCLPAEAAAAGKAWVAEFKDRLPACLRTPLAQAGSPGTNVGTHGAVVPRALVNLTQTDAHVAIAGSTDYQPGDVTLMEALIRHESRGHAR